nr:MAG TPA: hypothetical protein [Caudoviricetes sp.]
MFPLTSPFSSLIAHFKTVVVSLRNTGVNVL